MNCRVCGCSDNDACRRMSEAPGYGLNVLVDTGERCSWEPGRGNLCSFCAQAAAALRRWYLDTPPNQGPENLSALFREAVHGDMIERARIQTRGIPDPADKKPFQ
jgi:hypothetical protein